MNYRGIALAFVMALPVYLACGSSQAQQVQKIPRVGFLAPQGRSLPLFEAFQKGLSDLGYIEGRDIVIEPRFATSGFPGFSRSSFV